MELAVPLRYADEKSFQDRAVGEDWLPGADDVSSTATQHLARSNIIFALFDPTQDPRFRAACNSDDPQLAHGLRPDGVQQAVLLRQETLLTQAALRIRHYLGMSQNDRIKKPLIIVVPKADIWSNLIDLDLDEEPYIENDDDVAMSMITGRVEQVSQAIRKLLRKLCSEYVAAAEGLSQVVRYIPVSSLGRSPEYVRSGQQSFYGICPKDVHPKWVTVPLLYSLCKWVPGMMDAAKEPQKEEMK